MKCRDCVVWLLLAILVPRVIIIGLVILAFPVVVVEWTPVAIGFESLKFLVLFVRPALHHVLQDLDVLGASSPEVSEVLAVVEAVLEGVNDLTL